MATTKIAITIERKLLQELDRLVSDQLFPSRSNAIQSAVREKVDQINRSRLAIECGKLDQKFEQLLADEGIGNLEEWPEY